MAAEWVKPRPFSVISDYWAPTALSHPVHGAFPSCPSAGSLRPHSAYALSTRHMIPRAPPPSRASSPDPSPPAKDATNIALPDAAQPEQSARSPIDYPLPPSNASSLVSLPLSLSLSKIPANGSDGGLRAEQVVAKLDGPVIVFPDPAQLPLPASIDSSPATAPPGVVPQNAAGERQNDQPSGDNIPEASASPSRTQKAEEKKPARELRHVAFNPFPAREAVRRIAMEYTAPAVEAKAPYCPNKITPPLSPESNNTAPKSNNTERLDVAASVPSNEERVGRADSAEKADRAGPSQPSESVPEFLVDLATNMVNDMAAKQRAAVRDIRSLPYDIAQLSVADARRGTSGDEEAQREIDGSIKSTAEKMLQKLEQLAHASDAALREYKAADIARRKFRYLEDVTGRRLMTH